MIEIVHVAALIQASRSHAARRSSNRCPIRGSGKRAGRPWRSMCEPFVR
jgi:hypothetical protein